MSLNTNIKFWIIKIRNLRALNQKLKEKIDTHKNSKNCAQKFLHKNTNKCISYLKEEEKEIKY